MIRLLIFFFVQIALADAFFSYIAVSAATSTESVTSHEATGVSTESVTLNVTIAFKFSARLPKTITLDGSKKGADYTMICEGYFPANPKVVAMPNLAVTFSFDNKGSVTAFISQERVVV